MAKSISLDERADAVERKMSDELDVLISKSALFNMADGKLGASNMRFRPQKPQVSTDGRRSTAAENACKADARRFFQLSR